MGSEYFINSQELENKVRTLLPSQGGAGAGFDLSASTQIIPVIDLTESAEGSNVRQDLQTAVDFATTATIIVNATNTVILNNTGFFKVTVNGAGATSELSINLFDGTTSKNIRRYQFGSETNSILDEFIVFLRAGDSVRVTSGSATATANTFTRQIATIDGTLVNPQGF